MPVELQIREAVAQNQEKYKAYMDKHCGAKKSKFNWSLVRVKRSGILQKREHKYTPSLRIVEKRGPS